MRRASPTEKQEAPTLEKKEAPKKRPAIQPYNPGQRRAAVQEKKVEQQQKPKVESDQQKWSKEAVEGAKPLAPNLPTSQVSFAKSARNHVTNGGDGTAGISTQEARQRIQNGAENVRYMPLNDQGDRKSYQLPYETSNNSARNSILFSSNDAGQHAKIFHIGPYQ